MLTSCPTKSSCVQLTFCVIKEYTVDRIVNITVGEETIKKSSMSELRLIFEVFLFYLLFCYPYFALVVVLIRSAFFLFTLDQPFHRDFTVIMFIYCVQLFFVRQIKIFQLPCQCLLFFLSHSPSTCLLLSLHSCTFFSNP